MKYTNLLLILALVLGIATAQEKDEAETAPAMSLRDLAAEADLIALVRVLDTDYEYIREFPSGGTAFLQVLVPYKVSRPLEDIIAVYDEGLHDGECYFGNTSVAEEGRRHLVFLKFSPDVEDQYNGLKTGCALEVLVNEDNLYALRYPVNGMKLADDLSSYAQDMVFNDAYALLEDEEISPDERNTLLASGQLSTVDRGFRYTQGIEISVVRKLMGPEGLTLDRSLK